MKTDNSDKQKLDFKWISQTTMPPEGIKKWCMMVLEIII